MATPAGWERKARQLGNDVDSIYLMLDGIAVTQRSHGERLDTIDGKIDGLAGDLSALTIRVDENGARTDGLSDRVDGLTATLGTMDGKLDTVLALLRAGGSP
ncbi:MAG: hypothetical protein ACFCVG_07325 [Kineosporiaceae bacterium]